MNICDTDRSLPNALGVRASVPGNGSGRRVYARFMAQWWSRAKQAWLAVDGAGKTAWVYVGPDEQAPPGRLDLPLRRSHPRATRT